MKHLTNALFVLIAVAAGTVPYGCTQSNEDGRGPSETALSGSITVPVDPLLAGVLSKSHELYLKEHPKAAVTLVPTDVHETMDRLINGLERIAIIARDYTPEEDSLRRLDGADTLLRSLLARDAIVFFADSSFPYDTMSSVHLRQMLGGDRGAVRAYPKLSKAPTFIITGGSRGSVYGNVTNVVLSGKTPDRSLLAGAGTFDSVVTALAANPSAIGVGYLSQIAHDKRVKALRLSYTAPDGSHVWPKPVHVAYMLMGQYPFPVPIYVYLKDKPNMYNLPSGYMQFITRNGPAQRTFLDAGIEPGYAKFTLNMPE